MTNKEVEQGCVGPTWYDFHDKMGKLLRRTMTWRECEMMGVGFGGRYTRRPTRPRKKEKALDRRRVSEGCLTPYQGLGLRAYQSPILGFH